MAKDKNQTADNSDIFDQTATLDPSEGDTIPADNEDQDVDEDTIGPNPGASASALVDADGDPIDADDADPLAEDAIDDLDDDGDGDFFINMAKADETIKPMEAGTRLIASCNAADAKISGSGNPMIALRVKAERVISTPNASTSTASYKNRAVRDNLLFIPPNEDTGYRGTIWRANQAMRAFGVEPDHGEYRSRSAFMAMLQTKAAQLRGAVCEIEVGVELNDGSDGREIQRDPASGQPYPAKNTIVRYYPYTPKPMVTEDLPF